MVIDFNDLDEQTIEGFKGGKGTYVTRNFADDKCKIMLSTLKPGASTGLHTHVDNCEVVYVLEGTLTCHDDGEAKQVQAGQVHYFVGCPLFCHRSRASLRICSQHEQLCIKATPLSYE